MPLPPSAHRHLEPAKPAPVCRHPLVCVAALVGLLALAAVLLAALALSWVVAVLAMMEA